MSFAMRLKNVIKVASKAAPSRNFGTVPNMNWNYPTSVKFGVGRVKELPSHCTALGMKNPLIVTDPGLAGMPMIAAAVAACKAAGIRSAVFSHIQGNPVEKNVIDGVAVYKQGGHDGVIAFGGGSAMDAAKAVALMVGQTRPLFDYEDREDWWSRVIPSGVAPVIAIPTTSGTGSEVGRASVITDTKDHTKKIIFHPLMLPKVVILDPSVTVGLPAHLTAAVGMDALSHNLEAYCSPLYHPMAQGIALEGMKLVKDHLVAAVKNGQDLEARAHMQVASTMGATAFQKGLGAMHSLSHPLGAVLNIHHGLSNAVVMPYVVRFNETAINHKMTDLARYLNLEKQSYSGVVDWILKLREEIKIPHTLKECGVDTEVIKQLAPMAVADPSTGTNPIALNNDNVSRLYEDCINGKM